MTDSSPIPRRQPWLSAAAWRSTDVASTDEWTYAFSDAEREEIARAARAAAAGELSIETLTADDFDIPLTATHVGEWSSTLNDGRGFLLLRRFPVDLLDDHEIELAYMGLGVHFGRPVGQDANASLLGHVRDERQGRTDPTVRLYRTRQRQDFHTDGADLVGLLCLHRAKAGGESRIASSAAVYNEMLRRRPDLVDVMYEPMAWDRNGEESAGEPPFFRLAPFNDFNGSPRVFYIGWYIRDAQRHRDAPRLTAEQCEAMNLLESIANDPAFHLEMDFMPGDIQLLNNAKILHAREAYEDDEALDRRRHLLRLWLAAHRFESVEGFLRGGVRKRH
jgi:hypothetical protein